MRDIGELLARVEQSRGPDNALDIEIEIALFKPDARHISVRPNAAGTKLIYTMPDGQRQTCWAGDYTLNAASRAEAAALLKALSSPAPEGAKSGQPQPDGDR